MNSMKPEDLTYIEHNKIVYKGIQLKVTIINV